jgi:O-antigen/teichoic acid export membrane protein
MSTSGQTIAKNTGILLVSQVITWALTLLMTVFLPRYLGAGIVGKLHLANSIWAIVSMLAGFGMDTLMTKEIARAPQRLSELLGTNLILRSLLYVLGAVVTAAYVHFAGYPADTISIIAITGLAMLVFGAISGAEASLMGLEKADVLSVGKVAGKLILTVLTLGALFLDMGVLVIASVALVSASLQLFYLLSTIHKIQPFRLQINWRLGIWMLQAGFPYLLVGGLVVIYQQVDVILLSLLANESSIGWYGTAEQLFGTLLFIPTAFITAVFPVLSRLFTSDPQALVKIAQKSASFLLLLSMPIGLGMIAIAEPFVVLLFGPEFAPTGQVLMVLGIVLVFTYQNTLISYYLISTDRQQQWVWVMAVATLVTIPLDLFLIPWCQAVFNNGAIGGAAAFFITELGMMLYGLKLVGNEGINLRSAWQALRIFLAGAGMFAVTWLFRQHFILIPIIVGAVSYISLILLLRVIPADDFALLKGLVQEAVQRIFSRKIQPAGAGEKG